MTGACLYICETCVRGRPLSPGESSAGQRLADAVLAHAGAGVGTALVHRRVLCLNGCPSPCNVALRWPGKMGLRLSRVGPAEAESIVVLLRDYSASADGDVPIERWPASLRDKITVRTPPKNGPAPPRDAGPATMGG